MNRRPLLQTLGWSSLAIALGSRGALADMGHKSAATSDFAILTGEDGVDKKLPGLDSISGEFRKSAVSYETQQQENFLSPFTLYVCTSNSDLCSKLEIDQSFSASYGPYGGDEKVSFFHELHTTSTSTTILVYVRHVLHRTDYGGSVNLVKGLKPPRSNKQIAEFVRVYGDSYISSVTVGGEYYAAYVFDTQSTTEQSNLISSLHVQGLYNGVSMSGGLQGSISNFLATNDTTYTLHQSFSGVKNIALPDQSGLIDFALKFPSLDLDNPAIIGQSATGYEHIGGFDKFNAVAVNRRYFIGAPVAPGLTTDLAKIYELKNQVVWIKDIHKFYGYDGDTELQQLATQIDRDIFNINAQIDAFNLDPTISFTKPNLKSLQKSNPQLNYNTGESLSIGDGNGATLYDFGDPGLLIKQKTRISHIHTKGQKYLDLIATSFASHTNPSATKTWSESWGGGKGHDEGDLFMDPDEYITSFSGKRSDTFCGYICLTTNKGNTVSGGGDPLQMGEGLQHWSLPAGSFVVRFSGRGGSVVDQFHVVYAFLQPTTYG